MVLIILPANSALAAENDNSINGIGLYDAYIEHVGSWDTFILGKGVAPGQSAPRGLLDSYWQWMFQQAHTGKVYTAPGVSWINEAGGTATDCGNLESSEAIDEAAFYCARDKVMFSSPDNHGDAYDRTQAFGNGWNKGAAACGPSTTS